MHSIAIKAGDNVEAKVQRALAVFATEHAVEFTNRDTRAAQKLVAVVERTKARLREQQSGPVFQHNRLTHSTRATLLAPQLAVRLLHDERSDDNWVLN
ncbi:hypothetical protein D0Z00_002669 [Geotrichum galactomycetum]|uniref:Uncharacterized protein n=1 Tax=Geotrichum galactomycetum TaxID=27317 RepID=A0ACB6V3K3_9ASCO|nr:hypothetical protein D0Z00_002669 [Geotrichum candidum]